MALTSRASASWTGNLTGGSGTASLDSSKLATFDISWKARTEEHGGTTNPEELIGLAHASCYSMAFSNVLDKNGTPPTRIDTVAEVTFDPTVPAISGVHLTVQAQVEGLEDEDFQRLAEAAKEGCPVSKALTGTEITLSASLV
ncbi:MULTISPECIES: OsmC family peroxiredoxin [unclassified Ornithinimicrobium]|uniref:OsmC family peroxiredoxin n=1 Tax=unclassified Ornithinimicrobium TaxID=2615080 RepID=UPI00385507C6